MRQPDTTLSLFVNAAQELSLARSIDDVMKIVRTTARKLTGADGATFVLRNGDFCYYADEDAISPLWKGSRFPIQTCISGWTMLNRKAAVIEDIYADDRIPHEAYKPTFVKSLAMVPIRTLSPIGAIGNYWATQHLPSEEEVNLLQSLADIIAVAMENVRVYSELEERVKDRTRQLEDLNKELETFSYSVSHDLRAPLRAVIGYSKIAMEECYSQLNDSGKVALRNIEENADRMNSLIGDLLQFARLGHKQLEKFDVNTNDLVKSVVMELRTSEPHSAEIVLGDLHRVNGDRTLLYQVWINLLANAIKYSSKKEKPYIHVRSQTDGNEVVFFVQDNGVGFDMAYAEKLFGTFQRLHSERDFKGTGIGLALVKRIVHRHGGRVWAEAKVNEGATFGFSLPL